MSSTEVGGLSFAELELLHGELLPAREEMKRVRKTRITKKSDDDIRDSGNTSLKNSGNSTTVKDSGNVEQNGLVNVNDSLNDVLNDLDLDLDIL